jgi:mannose-6-phosphate isomerase
MDRIRLLRNPIREYAWGSDTVLAELLGEPAPSARPQAELWIGAHLAAPSEVRSDFGWTSLVDWIRRDPAAVLGPAAARAFGGELPFLLKVIAVERPLSLQAHPDAARARAGFERENAAGVPLDAFHRCYRDPNPKPELLCALTPFAALCGFRPEAEIVAQIDELRARRLAGLLGDLRCQRDRAGLQRFFEALMRLDAVERAAVVNDAIEAVEGGYGDSQVKGWIRKLAAAYPGDPGVLAPLFLNLLELEPGQALFLDAGELHAYLHGVGVEIMASSDNVLRGGLTDKHVDVSELLATLSFASGSPKLLTPRTLGPALAAYDAPAREFALTVLRPGAGAVVESAPERSVEILLCAEGKAALEASRSGEVTPLPRGAAALVAAAVGAYRVSGEATVFRASVPQGGGLRASRDDSRSGPENRYAATGAGRVRPERGTRH